MCVCLCVCGGGGVVHTRVGSSSGWLADGAPHLLLDDAWAFHVCIVGEACLRQGHIPQAGLSSKVPGHAATQQHVWVSVGVWMSRKN